MKCGAQPGAVTASRGDVPANLLASAVFASVLSEPLGDVLFLGYVVAVARSLDWRRARRESRFRALILTAATLGGWMLLDVGVPSGWGPHVYAADATRFPVTVLDYVPYLPAYLVLAAERRPPREIRSFLWAVLASLPFHAVLAWVQWSGSSFDWKWESYDVVWARMSLGPPSLGRLSAGFYSHVGLGFYATVCLTTVVVLWVDFHRHTFVPRSARGVLASLGFTAALVTSACLLLGSAARFSLLVAIFALPCLLLLSGSAKRWMVIFAVSLAAALFVLAIAPLGRASHLTHEILPPVLATRLSNLDALRGGPVRWRLGVFDCAAQLVRERPWAGSGIGAMAPECEGRLGHVVNHAHNYPLQLAAEIGVPAATVFLFVLIAPLAAFLQRWLARQERGVPLLFLGVWSIAVVVDLLSLFSLPVLHVNRFNMIFWWAHGVIAPYFWAPRSTTVAS